MKCLAPHYMGDFALKGSMLRRKGHNRIGNLLVPNKNYCLFEDWFRPLLSKMHDEQDTDVRSSALKLWTAWMTCVCVLVVAVCRAPFGHPPKSFDGWARRLTTRTLSTTGRTRYRHPAHVQLVASTRAVNMTKANCSLSHRTISPCSAPPLPTAPLVT